MGSSRRFSFSTSLSSFASVIVRALRPPHRGVPAAFEAQAAAIQVKGNTHIQVHQIESNMGKGPHEKLASICRHVRMRDDYKFRSDSTCILGGPIILCFASLLVGE